MFKKLACIFYIILFISISVLTIGVIKLDVIPDKYMLAYYLIFGFMLIVLGFCSFFFKKKVISIIVLLFNMIGIIMSWFLIAYVAKTNGFFDKLGVKKEMQTYYLIVNFDSKYDSLDSLKGKKIGVMNNSYSNSDVNVISYDNIINLSNDLFSNTVDAILLDKNFKDILDSGMEGFSSKVKTIEEVKVPITDGGNEKDEEEEEIDPNQKVDLKDSYLIYISGIDAHGSIDGAGLSDVNILLAFNIKTRKIQMVWIPRDSYVHLSCKNGALDKLTHAGVYGVNCSKNTIANFVGVNIDYYVRVNFDAVVRIVDAVGGVDVFNDTSFNSGGYYFSYGNIHLNGEKALVYARTRQVFISGDRKRGQHQEQIIEALINKISSSTALLSNYSGIIDSISDSISTNVPSDLIKKLVKYQLDDMRGWKIDTYNLDGWDSFSDTTYSLPGFHAYILNIYSDTISNGRDKLNKILWGYNESA